MGTWGGGALFTWPCEGEEQEARDMLARHREKMGNYYLGGEPAASGAGAGEEGRKGKKGRKGDKAGGLRTSTRPTLNLPFLLRILRASV